MIKTGLIGHPVAHSKSPLIHTHWMNRHGIEGTYTAIDIAPEYLQRDVQDLITQGYAGFNVTVPHKETIMTLCDELDETARAIGAVNTIVIKDGRLVGRNTDAFGFIENIHQTHPDFHLAGKTVMVLGAGGAAKAAIYGLQQAGVTRILLSNRTREKAEAMSGIEVIDWNEKESALADIDLLVNTTILGMTGKPDLDLSLTTLNPKAVIYDIVYAPLMTDLLTKAQAQGNPIITGLGMLFHQARPAFEAWHGVMPDFDPALRDLVLG